MFKFRFLFCHGFLCTMFFPSQCSNQHQFLWTFGPLLGFFTIDACIGTKCQDLFHQLFTGFKTSKVNFFFFEISYWLSVTDHTSPYLNCIKWISASIIYDRTSFILCTLFTSELIIAVKRYLPIITLERLRYHTMKRGNHSSSRSSHCLTLFIL